MVTYKLLYLNAEQNTYLTTAATSRSGRVTYTVPAVIPASPAVPAKTPTSRLINITTTWFSISLRGVQFVIIFKYFLSPVHSNSTLLGWILSENFTYNYRI